MPHRDRAWRRRVSRVVDHREEVSKEWLAKPQSDVKPNSSSKHHKPGNLSPVQAMRQDWQLRAEAEDGWTVEAPAPPPPSPEL
jgi:hypothetical protein